MSVKQMILNALLTSLGSTGSYTFPRKRTTSDSETAMISVGTRPWAAS